MSAPRFNAALPAPAAWEMLPPALRSELKNSRRKMEPIAAVLSPMLTVEEAYLLAKFIKGLSAEARLYLGWVPTVGTDENFPQNRKGNPLGPVKFTIRARRSARTAAASRKCSSISRGK